MNRSLNPRAETILLPTDQRYSVLRSSVVKDIARFGGAVASMVPPIVAEALRRKLGASAARATSAAAGAAGTGDS